MSTCGACGGAGGVGGRRSFGETSEIIEWLAQLGAGDVDHPGAAPLRTSRGHDEPAEFDVVRSHRVAVLCFSVYGFDGLSRRSPIRTIAAISEP